MPRRSPRAPGPSPVTPVRVRSVQCPRGRPGPASPRDGHAGAPPRSRRHRSHSGIRSPSSAPGPLTPVQAADSPASPDPARTLSTSPAPTSTAATAATSDNKDRAQHRPGHRRLRRDRGGGHAPRLDLGGVGRCHQPDVERRSGARTRPAPPSASGSSTAWTPGGREITCLADHIRPKVTVNDSLSDDPVGSGSAKVNALFDSPDSAHAGGSGSMTSSGPHDGDAGDRDVHRP